MLDHVVRALLKLVLWRSKNPRLVPPYLKIRAQDLESKRMSVRERRNCEALSRVRIGNGNRLIFIRKVSGDAFCQNFEGTS